MIWNRFSKMPHIQIPRSIIESEHIKEKLFLPLCIYILSSENLFNNCTTFHTDQFAEFLSIKPLRDFNLVLLKTINIMEAENLIIVRKRYNRLYIIEPTNALKDISHGFVKIEIDFIKTISAGDKDIYKMLTIYPYLKLKMGEDSVCYTTYKKISEVTNISERLISRTIGILKKLNIIETKQSCKSYKQKDGSYKWCKVILIADKTNPVYEKALTRYEQKLNKGTYNADENLW